MTTIAINKLKDTTACQLKARESIHTGISLFFVTFTVSVTLGFCCCCCCFCFESNQPGQFKPNHLKEYLVLLFCMEAYRCEVNKVMKTERSLFLCLFYLLESYSVFLLKNSRCTQATK